MNATVFLIAAIFLISLLLTMVGLGGGPIFSPLFIILGFAKFQAASASMSSRLKGKTIRLMFSVILFILCLKLLHRAFFGS